jgi:catechol 2,3-dioxygenase-like lactoylglutathione lyase family enzyme
MHFNRLIPELSVVNLSNSLSFYVDLLGFCVEYQREESKFVFLSLQGSQLMLSEHHGDWMTGPFEYPLGRGINFQMMVTRIDPILHSLENAGYALMKGPWESWYRKNDERVGQREFLVQDPDGYLLRFAERIDE